MLTLKTTAQFRKDYKLAKKRGLDLSLIETVIESLLAEKTACRKAQCQGQGSHGGVGARYNSPYCCI
jgi:mRNA-degrading endonuclease YafQ of YafQ-DinJ toxin-antitoxin module